MLDRIDSSISAAGPPAAKRCTRPPWPRKWKGRPARGYKWTAWGIRIAAFLLHILDMYDAAKLPQPGRSMLRGASRLWRRAAWVTARRSLRLISLQPHQPPPIPFIRARLGPWSRYLCEPLLLAQFCAAFCTRGRLEILRLRLGCRATPRRQPQYLELGHHSLQREAQPIADSNPVCRLDTLGVQMHFPAVDRCGRQAPRFVKTGVP
jgi:hypothetical protein